MKNDNNIEEELKNVYSKKIDFFSLKNHIYTAKIVEVYDGDTCFAIFKYKNEYIKFKIRMQGYDSPELKPSLDHKDRENEIINAKKAKKQLEEYILNKIVILYCGNWDKYGRLLGTIYFNNININELMIKNGFGYRYNGGTKH